MSNLGTREHRLAAVALAILASLAIFTLAEVIVGTDLRRPAQGGGDETSDITAAIVAGTSLIASLAGWAALATLERVTRRARQVWIWLAAIVLVLSFAGPMTAAGITGANKAWLAAMHVAVGAVLIPLLSRTARRAATTTAAEPSSPPA